MKEVNDDFRIPVGKISIHPIVDEEDEETADCSLHCDGFDFTPYAVGKKPAEVVKFMYHSTEIKRVILIDEEENLGLTFTDYSAKAIRLLDHLADYEVTKCALYPTKKLIIDFKERESEPAKKTASSKKKKKEN